MTFRTGASVSIPNENILVAFGLIKTVEHYLGSIGILYYADSLKVKGVPLSSIVVAMSTYILMDSNSMCICSDWFKDRNVRKELGLDAVCPRGPSIAVWRSSGTTATRS